MREAAAPVAAVREVTPKVAAAQVAGLKEGGATTLSNLSDASDIYVLRFAP